MFTKEEIFKVFGQEISKDIHGVSINSHDVEDGDLFVAIKGKVADGHLFIPEAFAKGAVAALISDPSAYFPNTILVDDTVKGLQMLGRYSARRSSARIIAVTGSVGKTTTTSMLSALMSERLDMFSMPGNRNSQIGVPLVLCTMPVKTAVAVMEFGSSERGNIASLVDIARPGASVITDISEAHRVWYDSMDEIIEEKSDIFMMGENQEFTVFPSGKKYSKFLREKALRLGIRCLYTFSPVDTNCNAFLVSCNINNGKSEVCAKVFGEDIHYTLNSVNRAFVSNSICAILTAKLCDISTDYIIEQLEKFQPIPGRGNIIPLRQNSIVIDDSYNANPTSMKAAIDSLALYDQPYKVAVLGDMGDMGSQSAMYHDEAIQQLNDANVDEVYLLGEHMKEASKNAKNATWFPDVTSIFKAFDFHENSVILVKASRYMEFQKISEFIVRVYRVKQTNSQNKNKKIK